MITQGCVAFSMEKNSSHLKNFTLTSLLALVTIIRYDWRLTLVWDQNLGLLPTTHSLLFTITADFKSMGLRDRVLKNLVQNLWWTLGEIVFRASQHFG